VTKLANLTDVGCHSKQWGGASGALPLNPRVNEKVAKIQYYGAS